MKTYTPRPEDLARVRNDFVFHTPIADLKQTEKYERIRAQGLKVAELLLTLCPSSRELSVALTNLNQVVFWANAAIARNEKPSAGV
jgi:hypothetical protein